MYWTETQDMWVQLADGFDLAPVNGRGGAASEASLGGTPVAEVAEFFP